MKGKTREEGEVRQGNKNRKFVAKFCPNHGSKPTSVETNVSKKEHKINFTNICPQEPSTTVFLEEEEGNDDNSSLSHLSNPRSRKVSPLLKNEIRELQCVIAVFCHDSNSEEMTAKHQEGLLYDTFHGKNSKVSQLQLLVRGFNQYIKLYCNQISI